MLIYGRNRELSAATNCNYRAWNTIAITVFKILEISKFKLEKLNRQHKGGVRRFLAVQRINTFNKVLGRCKRNGECTLTTVRVYPYVKLLCD